MRVRVALRAISAVGIGVGFFAYGAGRTLEGAIGAEPRAVFVGLLVAGVAAHVVFSVGFVQALVYRAWPAVVHTATALSCAAAVAAAVFLEPWAAAYVAVLVGAPTLVARTLYRADRALLQRASLVLAAALLAGAAASEAMLLVDEAAFASEMTRTPPTTVYARARAWPHVDAALVYVPGRGIHATD